MKREFESSHPFISFQLDTRRLSHDVWILLGEAQSKCEHVAGVPLFPEAQRELTQLYLAKGALATTAIEGNTLSEDEVKRHLAGKLHLPPSKEYLAREIDNIVGASNDIFDDQSGHFDVLSTDLIKELNARVLARLDLPREVAPGRIREYAVGVAGYRAAPHADCEYLLGQLCDWLQGPALQGRPGQELVWAVIRAALAHLYLAWIHPFGDGNGRTARLVEFSILVHAGVSQPSAHLLSNHYNATRTDYYRILAEASRAGDVAPFLFYAARGFVDGLREQLTRIREIQHDTAWRDYVYEFFRKEKRSESLHRKRSLVLALSERSDAVSRAELRMLTPELALAYAGKTEKALSRDLNYLHAAHLIRRKTTGRYVSGKRLMLAFRPRRKLRSDPRPDAAVRAPQG